MSLTCISCKLLFSVPELHHEHYKSDWHRYNLKRRIAELPPLTKEEFEKRAATFQTPSQEKEKISLNCSFCSKRFSSTNAMVNHLKSKKHLEMQATGKTKPGNSPDKTKSGSKTKHVSGIKLLPDAKSVENNSDVVDQDTEDGEWSDADSDWESCDDEEEDDMKKIVIDTNDCLFCDFPSDSTENNVSHMMEVHSFFIPDIEYVSDLDGLIAFLAGKIHIPHVCLWCNRERFKSKKSVQQHMIDKRHCKMLHEGDTSFEYADFYDYATSDNESFDEDALTDLLDNSDFELVLPSGATIGHRSLALYYKQNLKPVSSDNNRKVKKILSQYKSLGYTGSTGPAAVKRARDIACIQKIKNRYNLKLGIKNNKLQPHFRSQVMF